MISHVCQNCNDSFESKATNRTYCSLECYWESMRGTKVESRRKRLEKECEVCGDKFIVRECHSYVKTCSKKCGGINRRGQTWQIKERIEKECVGCGKTMKLIPSKSDKKFCSRDCYLSFKTKDVKYPDRQRFQGSSWQKLREKVIERDKVCKLCGSDAKQVHHKVPYSLTGDDSLSNLLLLCNACHLHIHRLIRTAKESGYKAVYNDSGENLYLMLEKQ